MPHMGSSFQIEVNESQTNSSRKEELDKWLVNIEEVEFLEQITSMLFKSTYKGKMGSLKKIWEDVREVTLTKHES